MDNTEHTYYSSSSIFFWFLGISQDMCMKANLFCDNVAARSSFGVLCLSVTLLSFPKQTVAMSGAKDLDCEVVSLSRLNASQTKILGLGK